MRGRSTRRWLSAQLLATVTACRRDEHCDAYLISEDIVCHSFHAGPRSKSVGYCEPNVAAPATWWGQVKRSQP
jgi:hypothetical protein